jgi:hypothetical protein
MIGCRHTGRATEGLAAEPGRGRGSRHLGVDVRSKADRLAGAAIAAIGDVTRDYWTYGASKLS